MSRMYIIKTSLEHNGKASVASVNKDCWKLYTHQKLILMEVHTYSVKAKSQSGKIIVKYIMITQKVQNWKKIGKGS